MVSLIFFILVKLTSVFNYHVMKKHLINSNTPKIVYQGYKEQLDNLYEELIRYIQLKGDMLDAKLRVRYASEIQRVIISIDEIHSEFNPTDFPEMEEPPESIKSLIDKNKPEKND